MSLATLVNICGQLVNRAWSVDQGSNKNHSPAYNFAPTVTKFCVMWEGLSLPYDTKFGYCRCKIVDIRAFPSWSLIHRLRWSGLIKAEPVLTVQTHIGKHTRANTRGSQVEKAESHAFYGEWYSINTKLFIIQISSVNNSIRVLNI